MMHWIIRSLADNLYKAARYRHIQSKTCMHNSMLIRKPNLPYKNCRFDMQFRSVQFYFKFSCKIKHRSRNDIRKNHTVSMFYIDVRFLNTVHSLNGSFTIESVRAVPNGSFDWKPKYTYEIHKYFYMALLGRFRACAMTRRIVDICCEQRALSLKIWTSQNEPLERTDSQNWLGHPICRYIPLSGNH